MRSKLKIIVKNVIFEYIIIAFIVVSSIHLMLDSPLNNPEGKL